MARRSAQAARPPIASMKTISNLSLACPIFSVMATTIVLGGKGFKRFKLPSEVSSEQNQQEYRQPRRANRVALGSEYHVDHDTQDEDAELGHHGGNRIIPQSQAEFGRIVAGKRLVRDCTRTSSG